MYLFKFIRGYNMENMKGFISAILISASLLSGFFCKKTTDSDLDWTSQMLVSSFYTDNANGTITDKNTRLTWMKCSSGQVWNSALNTCAGTGGGTTYGAKSYNYCDATTTGAKVYSACAIPDAVNPVATSGPVYAACAGEATAGGGWRVPTKQELAVLTTTTDRKTFLFAFPQTPDDKYFWTISSVQKSDDTDGVKAWGVHFSANNFGTTEKLHKSDTVAYLRCVR